MPGMSDFGFKVSKPGQSVLTAEDKDLVYNSELNTFKIFKIAKFTSSGNTNHGLDYPPAFFALENVGGEWRIDPFTTRVAVDSSKVYSTSSYETYVILFIENLEDA
jgi:hypothetical protein